MAQEQGLPEIKLDPAELYREEVFTDRRAGTLRRLTPVTITGADDPSRPMVEGHHGSHMCGECLAIAYLATVIEGRDDRVAGMACTMCLVEPDTLFWRSPEFPDACVCQACIKRSAGVLEKDKDYTWRRPQG